METHYSSKTLRLCMLMPILALTCMLVTSRLYLQNHVSEKNESCHQNVQGDEENDADSSDGDETGDENDSVIVQAGLMLWSPSRLNRTLFGDLDSYKESHLNITAPPPRS